LILPGEEGGLRDGEARAFGREHLCEDYAIGFLEGEWRQRHSVDHADDRRRSADAEHECGDRGHGEAGIPPELTQGVRDVLTQCVDPRCSSASSPGLCADRPALGLESFGIAELGARTL
jgi:hypothetical protein